VVAEASNVASPSLKLFRKRVEVVEGDAAGSLAGGIEPRRNDDGAQARGRGAAAMVFGFSASVSTAEKKGLNGGSGGQQQHSGSMNAPARSRVGAKAEHGGHAAFWPCARSATAVGD
jgi:hypothetical protein